MEVVSLNGQWLLSRPNQPATLPAQVPGCVHLDLHRNGLIEDPYYRDNEANLFWIGETDWIYRRNFTLSTEFSQHVQILLHCKGLDTLATIHINGIEAGRAANMYRTWEFDVKSLLQVGDNQIEIYFQASMPYLIQQEAEKGILPAWSIGDHRLNSAAWIRKSPCNFGWDWGPQLVTSGIWRDIELLAFNTARLSDLHILQNHSEPNRAQLTLRALLERLDADQSLHADITLTLNDQLITSQPITIDDSHFEAHLDVLNPQLWWPNGMGQQPLYTLSVELKDSQGNLLDKTTKRLGLRTLELERLPDQWGESFHFSANGVPFFAKGANWIPADVFPSRLTRADYARLIKDAADAHMNMLRAWGGGIYEDDAFFDLCDEYGICVWQDFMFACGTYPAYDAEFMASVEAEARDNVRRIRHHASLALWCGNNELEQGLVSQEWTDHSMSWEDYAKLFDVLLRDVVQELDPERAYWPGSPHSPHGEREDWRNPAWGDTHLWNVWHQREPFEWYRTCYHRFVSEFGFQSFPEPQTVATFTVPEDRNITSYVMEYHQRSGIGNQTIIHYLLDWFRLPTSFESTIWLSQILQGMAIQYAVEHWRRHMPQTMGALYWQLNDCWPAPSWSSIDSAGRWKALHYLARRFYQPLLVSGVEDVEAGKVDLYVTNDQSHAVHGMVQWRLTDAIGNTLESNEFEVTLSPRQSTQVCVLDVSTQLAASTPRNILLWLELGVGDQIVSENLVLFARPKHLPLSNPAITLNTTPLDNGAYEVTLEATQVALWTWLELPVAAQYSDNFVHLRPGRPVKVTVQPASKLNLAEFSAQISAKSLINTYEPV